MIQTALGLDTRDLKRGKAEFDATFRDMAAKAKGLERPIANVQTGLEAAGIGADKLGKVASLAGNLGPMALAGTAIGVIWQGVNKAVDLYKQKLEAATAAAGRHLATVRGSGNRVDSWVSRGQSDLGMLIGLSDKPGDQQLSHTEMNAAEDALERLKNRYGELDITIDKTTRRVYISRSAMREIARSNQEQAILARKNELDALQRQYDALNNQAKQRFTSSEDAAAFRSQAAALIPQINAAREAWAKAAAENDPEQFIAQYLRRYRAERNDRDEAENAEKERKEREKQLEIEKKLAAFRSSYAGSLQGAQEALLSGMGLGNIAEYERALRELEKAKGAPLTAEEQKQAARLGDLRYRQSMIGVNRQEFDTEIRSNELASLGGWYSSVVMPDAESINANILTEAQQMRTLLEEIKTELDRITIVGG